MKLIILPTIAAILPEMADVDFLQAHIDRLCFATVALNKSRVSKGGDVPDVDVEEQTAELKDAIDNCIQELRELRAQNPMPPVQ